MSERTPDQMLTVDERPAVRLERHYPHPVAKVWRAVSQAEHLSSWFPSPVEIELRPGGAIRFAAFAGDVAEHGRVLVVEPPHHLELAWGADRLIFEPRPRTVRPSLSCTSSTTAPRTAGGSGSSASSPARPRWRGT